MTDADTIREAVELATVDGWPAEEAKAALAALDRLVADRDSATECWREVVDRVAETEIERDRLLLGMEIAWGLITNANEGNWDGETEEWRDAAILWRDEHWHPALDRRSKERE